MNIRRNDLARCVVVVVLMIGLGGLAAGQPSGNQPAAVDLWSLAKVNVTGSDETLRLANDGERWRPFL